MQMRFKAAIVTCTLIAFPSFSTGFEIIPFEPNYDDYHTIRAGLADDLSVKEFRQVYGDEQILDDGGSLISVCGAADGWKSNETVVFSGIILRMQNGVQIFDAVEVSRRTNLPNLRDYSDCKSNLD